MRRYVTLPRVLCFTALLGAAVLIPAGLSAQAYDEAYYEDSEINMMMHKLGRGLTNVLFGWVEVPKGIAKEWRETDPLTGTVVGSVKGLCWGVARTFTGVYEVISFPFPVPRGYKPLMYPEFILPSVWGERVPVFRDEYMAAEQNTGPALDFATPGNPSYGNHDASPAGRPY